MRAAIMMMAMTACAAAVAAAAPVAEDQWPHKAKYLPVVLIHGINNEPRDWTVFVKEIRAHRPSCHLEEISSPFDGVPGSWTALELQKKWFLKHIRAMQRDSRFFDVFDLVCHSQGAVICNALAQELDHGLVRLISLAGPQLGVYGAGFFHGVLPPLIRDTTVEDAYMVAYEHWAQALLSPANLWNDPHHQDLFLSTNPFLPVYLGLQGTAPDIARRKRNFLNLQQAAYVVGTFNDTTYDLGIDPFFSGVWSFYAPDGSVVPMEKQPFFVKDTFGLRTLQSSGRLVVKAVAGVHHDDWIYDPAVIRDIVVPLLSPKVPTRLHEPTGNLRAAAFY